MNLVFLFFFILVIIITVFITSSIKFNIETFEFLSTKNKKIDYKIFLELYLFGILKICKIKLKKTYIYPSNPKIKKINVLNILMNDEIKIEKINLNVKVGTKDVLLTTIIVFIINTFISIALGRKIENFNKEKHYYSTLPIYNNNNILQLSLNCIIKTKLVHIIYIIYSQKKKESVYKNERTSNRKNYDYSYEQY